MAQRIGIVLAGGAGGRMGRPKGGIVWQGKNLAEHAAEAIWSFCGSVLISVPPGETSPVANCAALPDRTSPGRGPLAGIDAGFEATGRADLLVLACDYPLVRPGLIRHLLAAAESGDEDLVMFTDGRGRDHPLVGLWRRSAETFVRAALDEGRLAVRGLFPDLDIRRVRQVDVPGTDLSRLLANVNWPEQFESLPVAGDEP